MMVLKRVSMKKTNTGYSVRVFVNDGEVASALYDGIQKFFVKLEAERNPDRLEQLRLEAKRQCDVLKEAESVV